MMMALYGSKKVPGRRVLMICFLLPIILSAYVTSSQETTPPSNVTNGVDGNNNHHAQELYHHVWPKMKFGWRIIVGTIIGFLGSAFGTVGGVGGGGIFLPVLTLIVGFDAKSATAISKFMITGGAGATIFYNLKQRHPTLELPVIDYDLALLFQPMLMLGISLGVLCNVIFPNWLMTLLLILFFSIISVNAFLKGAETYKKETLVIKEARVNSQLNDIRTGEAGESVNESQTNTNLPRKKVSLIENVYWKELGLLLSVWFMILALEIGKNYTTICSVVYWILNLLQIPITVGVSSYEAVLLYKGKRVIASKGDQQTKWGVLRLVLYCICGIVAGVVAGLLGLGGGFILGPLFLELGVPAQVASATSTFAMTFSASMSVVEYYLLKRFPVPYALYFVAIALVAAIVGQVVIKKLVALSGRASVIIFILAFTLLVQQA
ncbi:sulfite exporter TauE/SafE family protein 3-like isoform X2 [Cicer arietinum]|uniref:sulfite exporter TauE/SafE family protein 3-like isoform X2 n=1 Tax=Cicer arietinum TaxID=3827 RepID=UPI003CC57E4B